MGFGSKKPPPPAARANKDAEDPAAGLAHLTAATACVAESTVILKTQATNLDLPPETMLAPVGQAVPFESLSDFKLLGSGEFCGVYKAALEGGGQVAVKMLKPPCELSAQAMSDLRREVWMLSRIDHPNIISFAGHGVRPKSGVPIGFFRLFDHTLTADLPKSTVSASTPWKAPKPCKEWPVARSLTIALQIASAMRFCHDDFMPGFRLLHRDIKPDNIGIAPDGRAILADFGLCKLWKKSTDGTDPTDTRSLTGNTGSLRYMAPEVALSRPYNHKAEVFSWTSLLYQMLAFQKPFAWMLPEVFLKDVCEGTKRCPIDKCGKAWPSEVRELMMACWSADPASRPEFAQIVQVLEKALKTMS
jgi:serine/threonine protein kinase